MKRAPSHWKSFHCAWQNQFTTVCSLDVIGAVKNLPVNDPKFEGDEREIFLWVKRSELNEFHAHEQRHFDAWPGSSGVFAEHDNKSSAERTFLQLFHHHHGDEERIAALLMSATLNDHKDRCEDKKSSDLVFDAICLMDQILGRNLWHNKHRNALPGDQLGLSLPKLRSRIDLAKWLGEEHGRIFQTHEIVRFFSSPVRPIF